MAPLFFFFFFFGLVFRFLGKVMEENREKYEQCTTMYRFVLSFFVLSPTLCW